MSCCAIADGYQPTVYIKPRMLDERELPLYPAVKFSYRMVGRMELVTYDSELSRLGARGSDAAKDAEMEKRAIQFVAEHIKSWDVKSSKDVDVPCTADNIANLHPQLFWRIYQIIRGADVGDKLPDDSAATQTKAELQGNSDGVSG